MQQFTHPVLWLPWATTQTKYESKHAQRNVVGQYHWENVNSKYMSWTYSEKFLVLKISPST